MCIEYKKLFWDFRFVLFCFCVCTFLVPGFAFAADCSGKIQCGCGDTLTESQTMWYDLNNCPANGLIIGADNITLNGNGHIIDGDGAGSSDYGIYINKRQGVTINNCNISEFSNGIHLVDATAISVVNNIANNNDLHGIYLYHSQNSALTSNTVNNNTFGIESFYGFQNTIVGNNANENDNGIVLYDGSQNNVNGNTANDNNSQGIILSHGTNKNVVSGNIANSNTHHGIALYGGSKYNLVSDNTTNHNLLNGVILNHASFNTVTGNTSNYNEVSGFELGIKYNNISGNELGENQYGMHISFGYGNNLWDNTFINNQVSAYEEPETYKNSWSFQETGNHWSDFASNPGYPIYYKISGGNTGVDDYPTFAEYYVDDADAEFVVLSGDWGFYRLINAYNGQLRYQDPGTGLEEAAWLFNNLVIPGTYEVYVWKFESHYSPTLATNVHFKVQHRLGVSDWILVNQSTPSNEWVHLGDFEFDSSSQQGVFITDEADGRVGADAVKLVYTGPVSAVRPANIPNRGQN